MSQLYCAKTGKVRLEKEWGLNLSRWVSVFVPQNLRSVLARLFHHSFSMFMSQLQFCSKHFVLFSSYPVYKGRNAAPRGFWHCIYLSERTKQHRSLPKAPRTVYETSAMNVFRSSFSTNSSLETAFTQHQSRSLFLWHAHWGVLTV